MGENKNRSLMLPHLIKTDFSTTLSIGRVQLMTLNVFGYYNHLLF